MSRYTNFKIRMLALAVMCMAATAMADNMENYRQALALRDQGDFNKATELLEHTLSQTSITLSSEERDSIKFEIERIARIRRDYTKTRAEVLEKVRQSIPDFSDEEMDTRERNGELDSMTIDGKKFYANSSASNLFMRNADMRQRRKQAQSKDDLMFTNLYKEMQLSLNAAKSTSATLVRPQDVLVTYTLVVNPNAVPAGQTLRAWLPVPRMQPNQTDFILLSTTADNAVVASNEAPQRTIYMEAKAQENLPTTFTAVYAYRSWARTFSPKPESVMPYDKSNPDYQYYTAKRLPHLDTDNEYLKTLNREIVGEETNPLRVAKRIFDWIGNNMVYQYAREYSTLENLSLYTAKRRAGDCGQHGMFFIAMCRLNGIPARWSTGWDWAEGWDQAGMHDWAEIYVEPWGWMPADPDVALLTKRNSDDMLTTDQKQALSDWLFCNQDSWRMTVNCDFSRQLYPVKKDFRSETVDFQRGEVESNGTNLYFPLWTYDMQVAPLEEGKLEKLLRK